MFTLPSFSDKPIGIGAVFWVTVSVLCRHLQPVRRGHKGQLGLCTAEAVESIRFVSFSALPSKSPEIGLWDAESCAGGAM